MNELKITYEELNYLIRCGVDVKVPSPTGFVKVLDTYEKYREGVCLNYHDGSFTKGATNHLVFFNEKWCFLNEIGIGDVINGKIVKSKENMPIQRWIDFSIDAPHESYYQNGILHHNSGKSLIQYLILREFLKHSKGKLLLIVPTVSLVTQMFNDFKDYSINNKWDVDLNCHMLYEGQSKNTDKRVIISTWQSIINEPSTRLDSKKKIDKRGDIYLEDFETVLGDEVHSFQATSLIKIMEKCINAKYRIGLTGTLDDSETNEMSLISLFSSVHRVATTSELMERDILSKLKIQFACIKYDEATCQRMKHADYHTEVDFIVSNPQRNALITKMSKKLSGNTLILVSFIEKHGKILEELIKEACVDKEVYFVYGNTDVVDRENIRRLAERKSNLVIIASYQVFSTGVNIKNLPNVMFASPNKSKIRLLQSIGRGIRKHEDKVFCRVIDLADDLRGAKKKKYNYSLEHALARLQIYQTEGFDVTEVTLNLNCS